ncbi:Mucin-associated surface protein (MASP) [Trypanosoma cruzi]|uniref:Mucin-associated surface protein (MASP), putative n=2 Tax=Trypanosoma cruzi TaxID=5693 RepID=Q4E3F2_TRYCC|nr:mucin-associated surface protein (MASP), putative [Trypanosoma cruzi]EAN99283.1 mucin-associated surface protein (MASP), putative [Trypanosoma cruzi]PWV20785.1 Mucin-associated surface protein (MASP) [Trypanosoma cruzi]|eukprot:XP_821134.1 mucin-associated surface protein (MASP) [Trypanosoma cruzi strain CL Brener]
MAMMMTGRVLLVCALCVLWCGAATVVSTAPDATRAQSVWPEYLFLNWHELFRNECKVENPYENEDLKGLAVNCCVRDAMRELCSSFYGKTVMENKDPNVEGICKEYAGKPDDVADCPKPQTNLSPAAVTLVKVSVPEAPKDKEKELRKQSEEAPKAPPEEAPTPLARTPLTNSPANPTNVSPSPPLKGQPANEEEVPVPNSEEGSLSTGPINDSEEGDTDTVTDTEQDEPSNSQAEPTTPTPTVASDNGDNETDKGTGEDTPNNTPEPDVAGTEEKQDEDKNNKPKERTLQVAGIKTTTATTGDSDGVKATSPLLLLVVACAAAAAVVAA